MKTKNNQTKGTAADNMKLPIFRNGDRVRIDVAKIKKRKLYTSLADPYKNFVDQNKDTVFTIQRISDTIVTFRENSAFLFWVGDLIKVKDEDIKGE